MQLARQRIKPTAQGADVDQQLTFPSDPDAVDAHVAGLQCQRRRDLRQRLRPARQFERFIALGQIQRGARDLQRIQPQPAAEQRPQREIQVHAVGGEHDRAAGLARRIGGRAFGRVAEAHAAQRQRAARRAVDLLPGERGVVGQARDDLPQQQVAAANRGQQPIREHDHDQGQRTGQHDGANGEIAQARATSLAQFGDALVVRVGRRVAHGHRLSGQRLLRPRLTGPRRC